MVQVVGAKNNFLEVVDLHFQLSEAVKSTTDCAQIRNICLLQLALVNT